MRLKKAINAIYNTTLQRLHDSRVIYEEHVAALAKEAAVMLIKAASIPTFHDRRSLHGV